MKSVWKFPVDQADFFTLEMPSGAQILSVQIQHGEAQMWALVDPNAQETEVRKFRLAGTGHPIHDSKISFVGTFQLLGGAFVGHLFEILS